MPKGDTTAANRARAEKREGRKVQKKGLADIFGRSVSWVEDMIRAGMPVHYKGGPSRPTLIDTAQAYEWLLARAKDEAEKKYSGGGRGGAGDGDDEGIVSDGEARRRINIAKAEMAELDLRKARGEVVEIAVMESALKKAVTTSRKHILAIPSIAPDLAVKNEPGEIQQELEIVCHEALHELATIDTTRFVTGTVLQSMGAAAVADSQ